MFIFQPSFSLSVFSLSVNPRFGLTESEAEKKKKWNRAPPPPLAGKSPWRASRWLAKQEKTSCPCDSFIAVNSTDVNNYERWSFEPQRPSACFTICSCFNLKKNPKKPTKQKERKLKQRTDRSHLATWLVPSWITLIQLTDSHDISCLGGICSGCFVSSLTYRRVLPSQSVSLMFAAVWGGRWLPGRLSARPCDPTVCRWNRSATARGRLAPGGDAGVTASDLGENF